MSMLRLPTSTHKSKIAFTGVVGDMGSAPAQTETNFSIHREFVGDAESGLKRIRGELSLAGVIVVSDSCDKRDDGKCLYNARCKTLNGGIPDFSRKDVSVRRFVGKDGVVPFFSGVLLYEIKSEPGKLTRFTFTKWICGELKHCQVSPEFTFTEDLWDSVCADFAKQEQHIMARSQKK